MGEFKPMVKMDTTEPSIELKLKKGGTVGHKCMKKGGKAEAGHKMMDGGMPSTVGTPRGGLASAASPKRPALSLRRRAMASPRAVAARAATDPTAVPNVANVPVMKKGGKCKATGGVVNGQGGYKTGGVVKGQGGYAEGGVIKSTSGETKMVTTKADKSPATTGGVKLGNGGGYKKGGATKKFASGGSVNDSGRAQQMPQGKKAPPSSVAISKLSGTYKKGGKVKKFADGGSDSAYADVMMREKMGKAYDKTYADETAANEATSKAMRDALLYVPRTVKSLYDKAKSGLSGQGSVTQTTKSTTVTPAKKHGGKVKK